MSKRQFKSQASSSRAAPTGSLGAGFGSSPGAFSAPFGAATTLSYLGEQPNLTSITDSNVVVNFKNLSKKDSTTKAKALEELQAYVSTLGESQGELEEQFLDAWVKAFPRASIDLSRRVRQDAHVLNGEICVSSGKRIAHYMPDLVGPWIAGLHDGDKPVMRAAQEALQKVFPTPEKQANLNKVYHLPILQFATDAMKETPATLSDDRITTKDDAEAKFSRVFSSNVAVIDMLLATLPEKEVDKHEDLYRSCITSDDTWKMIASLESGVRRSVLKLLRTALAKRKDWISTCLPLVCEHLLARHTCSNQGGTSMDFIQSLGALSKAFPVIWEQSKGHAAPAMRLGDLAKKGSQGGPPQFWQSLSKIFGLIPRDYLPSEKDQVYKLLGQIHSGITRKDEPRSHAEDAWNCYIKVTEQLGGNLEEADDPILLKELLFPIIQQHLRPETDNSQWNVSGPHAAAIVATVLQTPSMYDVAEMEWPSIANSMLERIKTSAPEQSKDYQTSQTSLISDGTRLFALENEILKSDVPTAFSKVLWETTNDILKGSQEVLVARNGKPYGAAGVIEAAVRSLKPWIFQQLGVVEPLMSFVSQEIPELITSPSGTHLVSILYECQGLEGFAEAWSLTLNNALEVEDNSLKLRTLQQILSSPRIPSGFAKPAENASLQDLIVKQMHMAVIGEGDFIFMNSIWSAPTNVISADAGEKIMLDITRALSSPDTAAHALSGLGATLRRGSEIVQTFVKGANGSALLQNLLLLTEAHDDELAASAVDLNKTLERLTSHESSNGVPSSSTVKILEHGLYEANDSSLSVETLVELAQKSSQLQEVLPDSSKWLEALRPFLQLMVPASLSLTNQLGGAIYLLHNSEGTKTTQLTGRDKDGYSAALRVAFYTVKLLKKSTAFVELDSQRRADIYSLLLLTAQLVNDNLSIYGSNTLWLSQGTTAETEMLDFTSEAQTLLTSWRNDGRSKKSADTEPQSSFLDLAHHQLFQASAGRGSEALHNAEAYAFSVAEVHETFGWQQLDGGNLEGDMKSLRKSSDVFSFASFVVAHKTRLSSTPAFVRICNELIAGLTGLSIEKSTSDIVRQLVYLNLFIGDQDHVSETIAKQRLIFFVKHVTPWLSEETSDAATRAETCKALNTLLPHMKDIYGTHWSDILEALVKTWNQEDPLLGSDVKSAAVPWLQASMKLAATLRLLTLDDESNDDLKDAWQEASKGLSAGLMHMLIQLGQFADEVNQPLQIVNELLGRQIQNMPSAKIEHIEELYPLMGAASQRIQRIAFDLLHSHIPGLQEQVSIDTALNKTAARLPDEVLSLIIDAPTLDSLADASFDRTMPLSLQSYLSSWLLVFDHFQNASDKVKNDYIDQLKEGDYLSSLLNFIFAFLGHGGGKPVDASKFEITKYSFGAEESAVKDVQWLLIHLYYLCLKRAPALTKSWWMECKSRQVVVNVETWTEKYISPCIIADALTTVTEWADAQDTTSDEAIVVKANQRTKEVMISKEIDDQMMSMAIRLPSNFPLGQAVLQGVNRVAVDEKKWRSWLLNSQGVITFSNNSLIDGIIAFRRNVNGALKGQTECAICYSLVSADKQLPTKRCGTCKNLFHGSCLYRWFKTSNSSSCPLCRNPFNYT